MQPIFIGGCDRSGTTMLGSILGNSAGTVTTPESQFIIDSLHHNYVSLEKKINQNIINFIENHWRFKLWEMEIEKIPIKELENLTFDMLITKLVESYSQKEHGTTPNYWIDHTPSNMKYALRLLEIFPKAKFVHIIRDGRGITSSFKSLNWGPSTAKYSSKYWTERVSYGLALEKKFPDKVISVKYEKILASPTEEINRICGFLGLEFSEEMLKDQKFSVPNYTKEQHALVGKPVNTKNIDSWENKLSNKEIKIFEYLTGDLLEILEYELKYKKNPLVLKKRENRNEDLKEFFKSKMINKINRSLKNN